MGYFDEYKERNGKCEYCKHHRSYRCAECYGTAFEDSIDLYTFIRARASKDAVDKFNKSDKGADLFNAMEQSRLEYEKCRDAYNTYRDKFIDEELERIESAINSI